METTTVTSENFDEILKSPLPVMIDFWADWCTPCRLLVPVVENIARNYAGKIVVCKCNVESDETTDLIERLGIKNLPTIQFYKEGQLVSSKSGAIPTRKLDQAVKEIIGIAYETAQV